MTRVLHLFDGSAGWQARVGITQLLDRLDPARFQQTVCALDRGALELWRITGRDAALAPVRSAPAVLSSLVGSAALRNALRVHRPDVIHAWGIAAARRARAVSEHPIAVTCAEPRLARAELNTCRALADPRWNRPVAFLCFARQVHRRLVERGVPIERCVIIRPGVDFAVANRARRGRLRDRLGASPSDVLVTCPEQARPGDGVEDGVWAACVVAEADRTIRVVLHNGALPRDRAAALAGATIRDSSVIAADARIPYEELVSAADVLVATAIDDIPVTSVAWAMAAGTVVVGAAGYALTELIAHKHNGLLFKRDAGQPILSKFAPLLLDRADYPRLAEVARGQAYEVFGLRRYADQVALAYDNLLHSRPASDGIADSAMAG